MAYNYSFADNEIYSAEDLNAITRRLVTSGVEDFFSDGVPYNMSHFNEYGQRIYTSGAIPETCLTLKVVPDGEGKILINPGKAFFDDGAVIEIEAGGESLSFVVGQKNYVYLKNDLHNSNVCYPCCTVEEPTGDFVMLAEINEKGDISDVRTFARGKLPGYSSSAGGGLRLRKTITFNVEASTKRLSDTVTFDLGPNSFEYILAYSDYRSTENKETTYYPCLGIYTITENKYRTFCGTERIDDFENDSFDSISYAGDRLIARHYWHGISWNYVEESVSFSIEGDILTVSFTAANIDTFTAGTYSFDIDLIIF